MGFFSSVSVSRPDWVCPSAILVLVLIATSAQAVPAELNGELSRGLEESEESFTKRQTSVEAGVNRDAYGRISGNLGVSHTTKGGHTFNGGLSHSGGRTSGSLGYSRTFDNGRGRVGVNVNRGPSGGTSYGIGGSWRFRRANVAKRQSKVEAGVNRDAYGRISGNLGVSHTTKGGHTFNGGLSHSGGRTSGSLGYSRTFDNGRGRVGVNVNRGPSGGTSYGIGGSWRFRRANVAKRQSKVEAGVNRDAYGRVSGNLGVSHTTSGGHTFNGGLTHSGGRTSGSLGYSRTFDNGRGRVGVNVNRGPGGGTSYGIGGSWRFRRAAVAKRQTSVEAGVNRDAYGRVSGNLGVSHTTSGGHTFNGGLSHSGGRTSGSLGYSKTFDNGRGRVGVNVNRGPSGGTSYGIGGSWRFRRGVKA